MQHRIIAPDRGSSGRGDELGWQPEGDVEGPTPSIRRPQHFSRQGNLCDVDANSTQAVYTAAVMTAFER